MRITASDVALWAGGTIVGPDPNATATGVSFDSRTLVEGQAFVAVSGARDGHSFLVDAARSGAPFALVHRGRARPGITCVEVDDTVGALAAVARGVRESLGRRNGTAIVGVTGSVGKTSTKNFVHAVLSVGFRSAHAAAGSFNNDLGLPATVINAPDDCDAMVLEMAMRGHGEIARLCSIAQPNVAVVTLIGDAHSDRVGGIEGVARAKGEIIECLAPDGTAVVNLDDPWMPSLVARRPEGASVVTFGVHSDSDVRFVVHDRDDDGCVTSEFVHGASRATCTVPLPGDHMAANAAAAVAVGVSLGLGLDECVAAIPRAAPESGRMRWVSGRDGLRVLDDSYNANSSSMFAALDVLSTVPAPRRVAVLGLIAEVSDAPAVHRAVADRARALGVELLALETDLYGVTPSTLDDVERAIEGSAPGTTVLVKGSRIADTGRVVTMLSR